MEADAKNVTGSVAAWNNRTSSAYSDVSDQVFSGCLVRRLSDKSPSDRKLVLDFSLYLGKSIFKSFRVLEELKRTP